MNIFRLLGLVIVSVVLSGCVSAYQLPAGSTQTSSLSFSRQGFPQGISDVSIFLKASDSLKCNRNQAVISQKKMAESKNNNITVVSGKPTLTVEATQKFRMMVRDVDFRGVSNLYSANIQMCDALVGFETSPGKSYEAILLAEQSGSCEINIYENKPNGEHIKVEFSEYKTC